MRKKRGNEVMKNITNNKYNNITKAQKKEKREIKL